MNQYSILNNSEICSLNLHYIFSLTTGEVHYKFLKIFYLNIKDLPVWIGSLQSTQVWHPNA